MRILILLISLALLQGCASTTSNEEMTEAEHYRQARESLDTKAYLVAVDKLEELQSRFPYGDYAEQAQIDLIYSRYRALDYPGAIAQADRFIRSFPLSSAQDYALYLRGLANYYLNEGLFDRFSKVTPSGRDMSTYRDAFKDFEQLVRRYPNSEYAADARSRMLFIRQQLAEHELYAARYYARRKAYIASANRVQYVIRHFQGTPAMEEAMAIQTKAYESMNQPVLAQKSAQVLQLNWPESEYLVDGEVNIEWWPIDGQRNWLGLLTFDLFD